MGFGACYIILPRYIQKLGLLDESVFLMGEEALLGNQVYSNGGEILYTPQVKVIHQDRSSVPVPSTSSSLNKEMVQPKTLKGAEIIAPHQGAR